MPPLCPSPSSGRTAAACTPTSPSSRAARTPSTTPSDKYNLSAEGKSYIAGLLKHAREITGICSQWVNSYKRLVPGYEAPVYVSWARRNRSALVRVPMYKPGKEKATRCEYRAPDPACNPYLAFAVDALPPALRASKRATSWPSRWKWTFTICPKPNGSKLGIQELPGSLYEAVQEVEKSAVVKEALGEHIFNKFIENKKIEWDAYRIHVSAYEIDKYLPIM